MELKLSNVGDGDVEKEPMFRIGDCVIRVRSYCQDNSIEWRRPHIRVPGYIYGACGVVERVCIPRFYGLHAPRVRLYRVRFLMQDIWPEHHKNEIGDAIEVEVHGLNRL